jgi:hypothetical protein
LTVQENPGVPVVEHLEDLWKVSKLQNERKKKEAEKRAREELLQKVAEDAASCATADGP